MHHLRGRMNMFKGPQISHLWLILLLGLIFSFGWRPARTSNFLYRWSFGFSSLPLWKSIHHAIFSYAYLDSFWVILSVSLLIHLLSLCLAKCPAHRYFKTFLSLSYLKTSRIDVSIFLWFISRYFLILFVVPYSINDSTNKLKSYGEVCRVFCIFLWRFCLISM